MKGRVCIVGAGAMGGLLGYFLSVSIGEPARFIVRRRSQAERVSGEGVELRGLIEARYPAEAYLEPRPGMCDVAIIAVKAYDVGEAYRAALKATGGGLIVIVSNGMGYEAGVDRARTVFGVSDYGATRVADGVVEVRGLGSLVLGPSRSLEGYEWLLDALAGGGCDVRVVDDVEPYRWLKLAINASINPLTALLRSRNRVILESPHAKEIAEGLAREASTVAEARGVVMPRDPASYLEEVARRTGDNYSSMLQDLLAGRRTEIDYINGYVAREAKRLGLEAPLNETLYLLVKALEEAMVRGLGQGNS
ncbi:MAG: 2-dehydropantoate 2-reductase [Desulfurococcales archaeon]|nr:2-dehydropantoate 2-reductase [Desulfurococcales archaeon]